MKVRDVMSRDVVSVAPDEMTSVAARVLARCNVGAVPVCDGKGRVHGLLTDRDIVLRCVAAEREPAKTPVREIMSTRVISAHGGLGLPGRHLPERPAAALKPAGGRAEKTTARFPVSGRISGNKTAVFPEKPFDNGLSACYNGKAALKRP